MVDYGSVLARAVQEQIVKGFENEPDRFMRGGQDGGIWACLPKPPRSKSNSDLKRKLIGV